LAGPSSSKPSVIASIQIFNFKPDFTPIISRNFVLPYGLHILDLSQRRFSIIDCFLQQASLGAFALYNVFTCLVKGIAYLIFSRSPARRK
jgi:hypothetical protein